MATYSIIDPPQVLHEDDTVNFEIDGATFTHVVNGRFLSSFSGDNAIVFKKLKINKQVLADRAYGYPCRPGTDSCWPETDRTEFEAYALTRLVWLLFGEIQKVGPPVQVFKREEFIIPPPENFIKHLEGIYRNGSWDPVKEEVRMIASRICGVEIQ